MNKYELVVMVDALLPQGQGEEISKQAEEMIIKSDGKVLENKLWLEKYKTDFKIKGCYEFNYYLIAFEMDPSGIKNLKTSLKLNESVLRYLITKSKPAMV